MTLRYHLARLCGPFLRLGSRIVAAGGFRMLILHDVLPAEEDALDELLRLLKAGNGVIAPEEAEELLTKPNGRSAAIPTVVTFDDGFQSNTPVARKILDVHGIKALFFVCPGLVDNTDEQQQRLVETYVFPEDVHRPDVQRLRLMDWREIRALRDRGHTIGSHSFMHRRLSTLTESEIWQDVEFSFVRLEQELGRAPEWFAYPFGDLRSVSPTVLAVVSRFFKYVCSGIRGVNDKETNWLALRRESVNLSAPRHYLRMVADGGLDLLYQSRRRLLDQMAAEAEMN